MREGLPCEIKGGGEGHLKQDKVGIVKMWWAGVFSTD